MFRPAYFNFLFQIPDPTIQIPDSRFQITESRFQITESRFQITESRFLIPQFRFKNPDSRIEIPEVFSQKTFLRKFYTRGRVTYGDDGRLGLRRTQSRKLAPETRGNCEPPARRERIGIRTQRANASMGEMDRLARLNDIFESAVKIYRGPGRNSQKP
jgi:hypothetical protein